MRLLLRNLVQHIEKQKRAIVYFDFADELSEPSTSYRKWARSISCE
ncbi:hypothetical protein [Aureimonas sp. ME7]|nr:hypothetical protein [Aureimonas sp. ME7]